MADAQEFDAVSWAIKALRDQNRILGYALAQRYYDGEHSLTFATEKFKSVFGRLFSALADNLCLPTGSLIVSENGLIPIETVRIGDRVETHAGAFRRVTETKSRRVDEAIVRLRTYGSPVQRMTREHPVLATRSESLTSITAKYARSEEHFRCYGSGANLAFRRDSVTRDWIPAGELAAGDIVWSPLLVSGDTRPDIEPEELRLLGWYLAEGSVSDNGRIAFTFNSRTELPYVEEVEELLVEAYGDRHTTRVANAAGTAVQVVTYSKELADRLADLGGRGSASKRLRADLMGSPETLTGLLETVWRGDGTRMGARRCGGEFTTTSLELADQLQRLLLARGIAASWGSRPARPGHQASYTLRLSGRAAREFAPLVGDEIRSQRYDKAPIAAFVDGHAGYAIAETELEHYSGEVHNFEVDVDESYVLPGRFTVHNCPAVVDSVSDRLRIIGVEADSESGGTPEIAKRAWEIWQRNRMDVRAPETHHEALLTGDGYALVYPNESGEAVIWSIPASEIAVSYDPNRPGVVRRAARVWRDDEDARVHIDVYFPDRTERYVTHGRPRQILGSSTKPADFIPYISISDSGVLTESVQPHDYGRVPVLHFPNRRYHAYGISELANVLPLQDALNKTLCDMLVAQEFSAFPQRWATGIEVGETDDNGRPKNPPFDYGVDRMLTAPQAESRFGAFPSTDLRQYVEVQENLRSEIARVSGTPLHYLFITRGDFPSGEAMKSAEARFTRKVEQRQAAFGNQWEDMLALALRIEDDVKVDGAALSIEWETASPTALEAGEPVAAPDQEPNDARARSAAQPAGRVPIGGADE